jgi:hypothetical protein
MKYPLWDRFASKLNSVDEAPEPLCSAMRAVVKPGDAIRLLILGPAFTSLGKSSIATLLAVLDGEWIVVSGMEASQMTGWTITMPSSLARWPINNRN